MSSSFFDLCLDILLDIFQYFSLNELFDIFIDVIPNLSTLINKNHIQLHINKKANDYFWNEFLSKINPIKIISLDNSHPIMNLSRFSSIRSIHRNLQSLYLFEQFQTLLHLEQLSLQLSDAIIREGTWLFHILKIPNLKKLKLDLMIHINPLTSQENISISQIELQSYTIKYLEIKLPITWKSLLPFLDHFPVLQTFRASLYQCNSNRNNTLLSTPTLSSLNSLQTLDLHGYFYDMSSIVTYFCSSISNLKRCYFKAMNVTDDYAFRMENGLIWKHLFDSCPYLIRVQVHLLMSIETNNDFNVRFMKDLMRTFNHYSLCEQYHFQMAQRSINRGYLTLTGDFDKKRTIKLD